MINESVGYYLERSEQNQTKMLHFEQNAMHVRSIEPVKCNKYSCTFNNLLLIFIYFNVLQKKFMMFCLIFFL